jgi:hypothetical protein
MWNIEKSIGRRSFATAGFGALLLGLAEGELHAQDPQTLSDADKANVQAMRDFHKGIETLTIENFTRVTSDDVVIWTPGLGPLPHVGRDAAFKAWMDLMKQRGGVGLRSPIHDVIFARSPYVISTRDDFRIGTDGKETGAGSNLMGFYAIRNGKVGLWYNGGGTAPGNRGAAPPPAKGNER